MEIGISGGKPRRSHLGARVESLDSLHQIGRDVRWNTFLVMDGRVHHIEQRKEVPITDRVGVLAQVLGSAEKGYRLNRRLVHQIVTDDRRASGAIFSMIIQASAD